jgi:uncharacterized protein (TIGR02444 family)
MAESEQSGPANDAWADNAWRTALAAYADPEVAAACLALQDEHGLCVPTLFCVMQVAAGGRMLTPTMLDAAQEEVGTWRSEVVASLRRARRAAKHDAVGTGPFYDRMKAIELEAERLLIAALSVRLLRRSRPADDPTAAGDTMLRTLLPTAPADRLAMIYDRYRHASSRRQ